MTVINSRLCNVLSLSLFQHRHQRKHHAIELDSPSLSATDRIPGRLRICPTTGTRRRKLTATGKKPLKRRKKPYSSTSIPIMGHPMRTMNMPPMKKPVALSLCCWKKNRNVLSRPMTKAKPLMNKMLPIASSPLSKNNSIPRNKKAIPNPASPTPIFWKSVICIILQDVVDCLLG